MLVGGVEAERRHGLVARRVDEEVEAIERALRRVLRRRAGVGVEEAQTGAEVVVLAVLVLRAVDVDVAVAGGEPRAEVVLVQRARDGGRRGAQHERGERGDAVADAAWSRCDEARIGVRSVDVAWQRVQSRYAAARASAA